MGLNSSPSLFHQALAHVLEPLNLGDAVLFYVDDIFVQSVTVEQHRELLDTIFQALQDSGLKLNPGKAQILKDEVKYLGVQISGTGRKPIQQRVEAVLALPRPTTVTGLRKFLGLVNFSREFIEGFAEKAKALYELLKAQDDTTKTLTWTGECQSAWEGLKQALAQAPALCTVHRELPFALQVFASEQAISAVLLQKHPDGPRILGYFSRILSPVEKGMPECVKQVVALHWAVIATEHIVGLSPIEVQTPHTPLRMILQGQVRGVSAQRLTQWIVPLSEKNIAIVHGAKYVLPQLMQYEGTQHDCVQEVEKELTSPYGRLHVPGAVKFFVDGARYWQEGQYWTGFAVFVPHTGQTHLFQLPPGFSAQRAELEAVQWVIQNTEGRITIFSDSAYVVRSLCDYLPIWAKRGMVDATGKPIQHAEILMQLFQTGMRSPDRVSLVKVKAHLPPGNDEMLLANAKVDTLAKKAAVEGEILYPEDTPSRSQISKLEPRGAEESDPCFLQEQQKDPNIVQILNQTELPTELTVINGVLCKQRPEGNVPYMPQHLEKELVKFNHDLLGHIGIKRLVEVMGNKYYSPTLKQTCEECVQACLICAQVNPRPKGEKPALKRVPIAGGPWETLQIDFIGPLPIAKGGLRFALVIVDVFTKYVEVIPLRSATALCTAKALWEHVFSRWGLPKCIESDQGPSFVGQVMKTLCALLGIDQRFHIPYRPQSSGMVERMNRTLKTGLKRMILTHGKDWVTHLPAVMMAYRATPAAATKVSPHELMTGKFISGEPASLSSVSGENEDHSQQPDC